MKTSQQLRALITLAVGLAPSFVLAQSPPGAPPPQSGTAAAPVAAAAPRQSTVAARQPVAERQTAKRPARRQKDKQLQQGGERPAATLPGFRMLADGGSRVFLQVNGKVDVTESKADGRLVYRLKGVQTIQTNRFPLVTSFFATPVAKVQLVGQGDDLEMVIDLRERAEPKYTVVESERGIVLQVDFPKAAIEQRAPADLKRVSMPEPSSEVDDGPTEY